MNIYLAIKIIELIFGTYKNSIDYVNNMNK